jgi:predicted acyltransferase (DUF342 family)
VAQSDERASETKLIALAQKKFGALTAAERKLFRAVANGEFANYSSGNEEDNDPAGADAWGEERVIKADRIAWLCTDRAAKGEVSHKGIQVIGARIEGRPDLEDVRIPFSLLFYKCAFPEGIMLLTAIVRTLNLTGTHSGVINANGLIAEGDVFLRTGFRAEGEVVLRGAKISGQLDCSNGQFINVGGKGIIGDAMEVGSNVFLRNGFRAEGEVILSSAKISGQLVCSDGQFINPGGMAIVGDAMQVAADVFLRRGFKAEGEVNLRGAKISGQLACDSGQFINPGGEAIIADAMEVGSYVFLSYGFKANGEINLVGAQIAGCLVWKAIDSPEETSLDLRSCKIGILDDDSASWPSKGKLYLHGLTYNSFYDRAPQDAESRIEWLNRQPEGQFRPQPYEQLAKVLREGGREEDAKKIMIAKNWDQIKFGEMPFFTKQWRRVMGLTIGFGYRPLRALWLALLIIALGVGCFGWGSRVKLMTPVKKSGFMTTDSYGNPQLSEDYPRFYSIMYSIDLFVPLVDLHQANYWMPTGNLFLSCYMWFHIVAGWVLSTLFVVGLTGVLKT